MTHRRNDESYYLLNSFLLVESDASAPSMTRINVIPMIDPTQSMTMNNHGGIFCARYVPVNLPIMKAIQKRVLTLFASAGS